jgi:hypothetical protein
MKEEYTTPSINGIPVAHLLRTRCFRKMLPALALYGFFMVFVPIFVGYTILPMGIYILITNLSHETKTYKFDVLWPLQVITQLASTGLIATMAMASNSAQTIDDY